jgi:uncharacterized protein YjdB
MKMKQTPAAGTGRAARLVVLILALFVISCDDSTGLRGATDLSVAFSIHMAGGAADAFDAADAIRITIANTDFVVYDEVLPFSSAGSDVRIRLPVDAELDGALLDVSVELLMGQASLFLGSGTVRASSGTTDPVDIVLEPVVAAIVPQTDLLIPAIGGTLQLNATAVFATGDTITNVTIAYQLLDQGIIRLLPGGVVTGDREGTARVRASAGGRSVDFEVEVRILAATVTVSPAQAVMGIGGTLRLVAQVLDASGEPMSRQPTWSSANTAVATVTATGVVTAIAAGTVTITATVDDAQGTSQIEVSATPRPATPTGVSATAIGTDVTLAWQDNATNETSYDVQRGPAGGALTSIAALPANSNGYVDAGLPIDQVLDYVVSACNQQVCSPADRVTTRTVPAAPTGLAVLFSDPGTRSFRLGWTDASAAETEFRVEFFNPSTGQFEVAGVVAAGTTQFDGTGPASTTTSYRVVACNPAGCSLPSNTVIIAFAAGPPTAITLATLTGTEMVGSTDADGEPHEWWFEYYHDPSFVDPNSSEPVSTIDSGIKVAPLNDLASKELVYYRVVAANAAGTAFGSILSMVAPELEAQPPSIPSVCNQGSSCGSLPQAITFRAISTGPVYTYPNPFQSLTFDVEFPFVPLGSGSVSVVDDPIDGVRAWVYSVTVNASVQLQNLIAGNYSVVVRGYTGSFGGNVLTGPIAFTIAN